MVTRKETIASIRKMFERHMPRKKGSSYSSVDTEPYAREDAEDSEEGQMVPSSLLSPTGAFARNAAPAPDPDPEKTEKEPMGLLTPRWAKDVQIAIELILKQLENETVQPPAPPPLNPSTIFSGVKTVNSEEHVDEVQTDLTQQLPPWTRKTEVLEPEVVTASSIENLTPLPVARRSYPLEHQGEKLGASVGVVVISFAAGSVIGGCALFVFLAGLIKLLS